MAILLTSVCMVNSSQAPCSCSTFDKVQNGCHAGSLHGVPGLHLLGTPPSPITLRINLRI